MSKEAQSLYQAVKPLSSNRYEEFNERSCDSSPLYRRLFFSSFVFVLFSLLVGNSAALQAATYRTDNFVVHSSSSAFARKVGDVAEQLRGELSVLWLGQKLPKWGKPCDVYTKTGNEMAAGGETTFTFSNGEVYDWKMTVQGSEDRILDSVLPHEITHTILASYLRAPAPRWLDEGMATSVEASSERMRYRKMLVEFLHTDRGIAFNNMISMKDYPEDLTPFYSQAFSVCEYLILIGGRQRLIEFAREGNETDDWNAALRKYYQCESLGCLQRDWVEWVREWEKSNLPVELPPTRKMREFNPLDDEGTAFAHNERLTVPSSARLNNSVAANEPRGNFNPAGRFWDNFLNWGRQERATDQNDKIARAQNTDRRNAAVRPTNNVPTVGRSDGSGVAENVARVVPETTMEQNLVLADRRELSLATSSLVSWDDTNPRSSGNILANGAGSATKFETSRNTDRRSVPIYDRSF
ncbi:MAG: hypothetical protein J6X44_12460 [Thermoguttaceae bacterium]|nr:hypothetical protein [Thermoguttaceae bacterium]